MLRIAKLVFVVIFALNQVTSAVSRKIQLTVYYESRCPDSERFVVNQLQPTIQQLRDYISLELVPFGKASSISYSYNAFKCQHGPSECAGNMVQSCALDLMQGRSDVEKVSYVACEMQTEAGTRGDMKCVQQADLNPAQVKKCTNTQKGINLQLQHERLTKSLRPKFIPTITVDGVFNQRVQDSAMWNLKGTLCSIHKNLPPCSSHYNSRAMQYI